MILLERDFIHRMYKPCLIYQGTLMLNLFLLGLPTTFQVLICMQRYWRGKIRWILKLILKKTIWTS